MKIICFLIILFNSLCFANNQAGHETLELEFVNNLPFIKLQVEGKEVKCLLDTGARNHVLVLDKEIIAKLQTLKEFPRKDKSSDITGKEYIGRKYILPKFNIGQIKFLKVRLAEDTNWGFNSGEAIKKDGVVGLALFENKAIIIDYPNKKFILINDGKTPENYDIDNWQELDFKLDLNGLSMYANVDNNGLKRFILDSGANVSIIKPSSLGREDCKILLDKNKCGYNVDKFLVKSFNLGPILLYLQEMALPQIDGILGYNFLADKIIYIDFAKRIIRFKP
jgi:hypothetical protein